MDRKWKETGREDIKDNNNDTQIVRGFKYPSRAEIMYKENIKN